MRYIAVCEDESLCFWIGELARNGVQVQFVISQKGLHQRLVKKGFTATLADPEEEATYRGLQLKPQDTLLLWDKDQKRLNRITGVALAVEPRAALLLLARGRRPASPKGGVVRVCALSDSLRDAVGREAARCATFRRVMELRSYFEKVKRLLILTQHDPDPDAIACGVALQALLGRNRATAPIASFGKVTRPENLAMLKHLKIRIGRVEPSSLKEYDGIAMVDVQPPYFGKAFPRVDLVIDHHPEARGFRAHFRDIRASYGATATIMTEYLRAAGAKFTPRLATALLYGIKSDTLLLDRETSLADLEAYMFLYSLANHNLLRRIDRPELPIADLEVFLRALRERKPRQKVLCVHLGKVNKEDIIPRLADFGLQMEKTEWSVVSGIWGNSLVVSVRNVGYVKSAGEVVRDALGNLGSAGGHRSMAKAIIPLPALKKRYGRLSDDLVAREVEALIRGAIRSPSH